MIKRIIVLTLFVLFQACATVDRPGALGQFAEELAQMRAQIGPDWPRSNARLTTSGDVYMANLNAQAHSLRALMQRQQNDALVVQLASSLFHRFQITGRLVDAEQARKLVADAYERNHNADLDLLYAEILLGFHEFALAQEVLATALTNGAQPAKVAALRLRLRQATEAVVELPELEDRSPVALANRANVLFDRGQVLQASRLLKEAQDNYRNTAPYLLSWIQTQQGTFFLRLGDYESARQFFAAARGRLPQYASAVEHLAETEFALGNRRIAAELYRSVAQQTDNPEFHYQLAKVERSLGNLSAASRFTNRAAAGYASLINRYPLMYVDHAARYYLAEGDIMRSLKLAKMNIAARQDYSAQILLLEIYTATGDTAAACAVLSRLHADAFATPEMQAFSASVNHSCN